ncbi:MAG: restriction endonuclease [Hungatella sp.]|nr:restriction endonuclease [Hungatella sp.]MCI9503091.1 restriction endonuclease [Hungatella sp.]
MAERTFGWVQEAYVLGNLKRVVQLFLYDSPVNKMLREDKIPRLVPESYGRDEFIRELSEEDMAIPYTHLKGKGIPKGFTRSSSPCTGIVQAALPGQRKEYQGDWPADSFLRWAVSVGFLDYDRDKDTCALSEAGKRYAASADKSPEEEEILTEAFLSYPPVCRIVNLLVHKGHMTKFELGGMLGFIGEAGFTSIPQSQILQGLKEADSQKERSRLLADTEGTSDKYVRTICGWLKQLGWVEQEERQVTAGKGSGIYTDTIPQAYRITLKGRKAAKGIKGTSRYAKIPKRVLWDMLATKAGDRDYLRNRRTYLIQALVSDYRTLPWLAAMLEKKGIPETESVILDEIRGFENIGLSVSRLRDTYKITDKIQGLAIPSQLRTGHLRKSDRSVVKDEVRKRLEHVDHKYLILIDLGFDSDSNRDYEIQTAELLTTELELKGARLGDTRKPDVCVYYGKKGLILDNKAYSKGYPLPMSQADEMVRYIEENKARQKGINPNEWWKIFDENVDEFHFAFVSGEFVGGFQDRLNNISHRTGVSGGAVNSVNLLLLAEELKSGRMDYDQWFEYFSQNAEAGIL